MDDLSEGEHYQGDKLSLIMFVELLKPTENCATPWENHMDQNYNSDILFSSKIEAEETRDTFGELIQHKKKMVAHYIYVFYIIYIF